MPRMMAILAAMLLCLGLRAQADSIGRIPLWRQPATLTGAGLVAVGTAFTFSPTLHGYAMRVNEAYSGLNPTRYHFDDNIQYLPIATPLILGACGLRGEHRWIDVAGLTAVSYLIGGSVVYTLKHTVSVERPSGLSFNSFPSGHTFTSVLGAEIIRREYGSRYPLLAIGGYAIALLTAFMRIHNNMHWLSDLATGAGFALLGASVGYWIGDRLEACAQRRALRSPLSPERYLLQ